ncbi:unnamed protein product [Spirodela intermedia]|uniref:ATP-dependent (S)-NAD(P)H-hydrate dehydratase n=1 Tax=Spirodela intermedia TaxID=51605 RepID=A0A7I8IH95_SPIIN|nr:unnamed protein product [Spirodela intermedia]CAA6656745.1 unnamed protein product [Spirodela intermedia]
MCPLHTFSSVARSHNFAASAVSRRQQFLIRSLGGVRGSAPSRRMAAGVTNLNSLGLEADAGSILKRITPPLDSGLHKGQAGKIAVIGGCREYTGAPYFAAISALKIGADLSHVFCTKDAAPVIKSYSPELIVHPVLEESYSISLVVAEVKKWMERFDCLVVGQVLEGTHFSWLDCISEIMRHARQSNIPIVVDGDGLFLVTNNLGLIAGYSLAVLTPNVNEYKRLVEKVLGRNADDQDAAEQLLSLSRSVGGATILRKGNADLISDGETVSVVSAFGSPRRCGGQGDILSGSVAVFSSWARQQISEHSERLNFSSSNPMVLGCIAGSALLRKAASLAFAENKRATLTTDIIESLGASLEEICPAK